MNEFVINLERDVQLPVSVTTLDRMSSIVIDTVSIKYTVCWHGDILAVFKNRDSIGEYVRDKEQRVLIREFAPGFPITYRLERSDVTMATKKKKKKKGLC